VDGREAVLKHTSCTQQHFSHLRIDGNPNVRYVAVVLTESFADKLLMLLSDTMAPAGLTCVEVLCFREDRKRYIVKKKAMQNSSGPVVNLLQRLGSQEGLELTVMRGRQAEEEV
jgi:hypothetical protein